MGIVDNGIELIGEMIANTTSLYPDYLEFATGSIDFTGTETSLTDGFIRKSVSWSKSGINSMWNVELSSIDAVGSIINSVGLATGSEVGSGTQFSADTSFIGSKNNTFNVQVEGEVLIRRPF